MHWVVMVTEIQINSTISSKITKIMNKKHFGIFYVHKELSLFHKFFNRKNDLCTLCYPLLVIGHLRIVFPIVDFLLEDVLEGNFARIVSCSLFEIGMFRVAKIFDSTAFSTSLQVRAANT